MKKTAAILTTVFALSVGTAFAADMNDGMMMSSMNGMMMPTMNGMMVSPTRMESELATPMAKVSMEQAVQIAMNRAGEGYMVKSAELNVKYGTYFYEVELQKMGHEVDVTVDAITGGVLKYEEDGMDMKDMQKMNMMMSSQYIGLDRAAQIAQQYAGPGYMVTGKEFDMDKGMGYYDIDLVKGMGVTMEMAKIRVDAISGGVLFVHHKADKMPMEAQKVLNMRTMKEMPNDKMHQGMKDGKKMHDMKMHDMKMHDMKKHDMKKHDMKKGM